MTDAHFTLSKSIVIEQYNKVAQVADVVSYSSKTNPLVTPVLEEATTSLFSVHLVNELKHVKDMSRVLFLAQGLTTEILDDLFSEGIRKFVIDNEPDLDLLISYLERSEEKIELFLRMKLRENTIRTERYFVFGIAQDVVNQRVRELWGHKNISSLGIHFHRKTQNMAEWNYEYEIKQVIDEDVLEIIDFLNIGGGLPSTYANTNKNVIDSIFTTLGKLKTFLHEKEIKLIIEPGRFIAAPAGKLYTKIVNVYENNIIVNASVYNADMDALIVPVKLLIEGELDKNEGEPYVVKGKTPCSLDLFRYRVYLKNPKVGNELVFLNAGAYNFTTNFCDLEEIKTKVIL